MIVSVESIRIPAWSSIGYGSGRDSEGRIVQFFGDHRPLREIGEALSRRRAYLDPEADEQEIEAFVAVLTDVDLDQVIEIEEPDEE